MTLGKRAPLLFAVVIVAGLIAPRTLHAQWNHDPRVRNPITTADSVQRNAAMCTDGAGGAYIVWEDVHRDTVHSFLTVQRIDDMGVTRWRTDGLLATTCADEVQHNPKICPDGAGGCIVAWHQDSSKRQLEVQRLDSNGNKLWSCSGIHVNNTPIVNQLMALVPDGANGAYMIWSTSNVLTTPPSYSIYCSRVLGTGALAWGAPTTLASFKGGISGAGAAPDSLGNCVVGMCYAVDYGTSALYVQKIGRTGAIAWAAGGKFVDSSAFGAVLAPDGKGNVLLGQVGGGAVVTMYRISPTGTVTLGGPVGTGNIESSLSIAYERSTDTYVAAVVSAASKSNPIVAVQRFSNAGVPMWSNPVTLTDPDGLGVRKAMVVADGFGGAYAAWTNFGPQSNAYAQHLDSTGALIGGSIPVCTATDIQEDILAVGAYPRQALCAWTDWRDTTGPDIYATKIGEPWLVGLDTVIDFGRVNVGETVVDSVPRVLANLGVDDLQIASFAASGPNVGELILLNDTTNITLSYRQGRDFVVQFAPSTVGPKSVDIAIASTTRYNAPTVHLRGRGVLPAMQVTGLVDFKSVPVGGARDSTVVRIARNTGNGFLHIDSMSIAGGSGAFSIDSGNVAPFILDSAQQMSLRLRFAPVTLGNVRDSLFLYTNNPSKPVGLVILAGTGAQGRLVTTTSKVDFGTVDVGTPLDSTVTRLVRNTGTAADSLTASAITGADAASFSLIAGGTPFTLAGGASRDITLEFKPLSGGPKSATLVMTGPNDTLTVELAGNGRESVTHSAVLAVSTAGIDFGTVTVGAQRDSIVSALVQNTGDTALVVTAMHMSGATPGDFAVDDSAIGFTLDPGSSKSLTLHFMPSAAGLRIARLGFTSNSTASPTIVLTGTGEIPQGRGVLTAEASSIDAGTCRIGSAKTVVRPQFFRNTGASPVSMTSYAISGPNASDFALTSQQSFTLAVGATAECDIMFSPGATGPRSATLTLYSDAGDTVSVQLSGTGTQDNVALDVTTIDFGAVAVGQHADTTIAALLRNAGTDTAVVLLGKIGGSAEFSLPAGFTGRSLAPLDSMGVTVRFAPPRTGPFVNTFVVVTQRDTLTVVLRGRGVKQLAVSLQNARGSVGQDISIPLVLDSAVTGTSITGLRWTFNYDATQIYPQAVLTNGTATAGWAFTVSVTAPGTAVVTGTGTTLGPSTQLAGIVGTLLQTATAVAPISLTNVGETGDSDVTMTVNGAAALTVDSICGYGRQTFVFHPSNVMLWSAWPSPAHDIVHIPYYLEAPATCTLEIWDASGRLVMVRRIDSEPGYQEMAFSVDVLASGAYMMKLSAPYGSATKELHLTR